MNADPYVYLDEHSGEYDDYERQILKDPYADGWAWREAGKRLCAFFPPRCMPRAMKEETVRLFKMGFRDCKRMGA